MHPEFCFRNKLLLLNREWELLEEHGARATCTDALKLLRPKAVIGVGVCYGMNKDKQELGDVLVSESIT